MKSFNPIISFRAVSNYLGMSLFFSYETQKELDGYSKPVDILKLNLLFISTEFSIGVIIYE